MKEALWLRVEEALDARRDPLDDAALVAALEAEPGAAAQVRRLMARLAALQPVSVRHPRAGRRGLTLPRLGLAAALVASLGALLWYRDTLSEPAFALTREDHIGVSLVVERLTPPPPRGRRVVHEPRHVLQWTLEGSPE